MDANFGKRCKAVAKEIAAKTARAAAKRGPDPFFEGFAIAVADLARDLDHPTLAASLIAGHGFTLADFKGCDDYDLKVIRKLFREESQLSRSK